MKLLLFLTALLLGPMQVLAGVRFGTDFECTAAQKRMVRQELRDAAAMARGTARDLTRGNYHRVSLRL